MNDRYENGIEYTIFSLTIAFLAIWVTCTITNSCWRKTLIDIGLAEYKVDNKTVDTTFVWTKDGKPVKVYSEEVK